MPEPLAYRGYPIRIREVALLRRTPLSATMTRLTLGGSGAAGFESAIFDEHIKLIFPDPDSGEIRLPVAEGDSLIWPKPMPTSREYTVRNYRPESQEIDIDFVIHDSGLASDWARDAEIGDRVHLAGPPGGWQISPDYEAYVLVGDETALPAIARFLERAPHTLRGWIVIEVPGPDSRIELAAPPLVEVTWIYSDASRPDPLDLTVRSLPIPAETGLFVWLAGEAGSIKPLRRWVRAERGLTKQHSSITGYWKRGQADTHVHLDDED